MDNQLRTGSRIRAARQDRRIRQADLARSCDISASYLNLIEHNRRRIGGALLNKLAKALDIDPANLNEGFQSTLTRAIESAAARHPAIEVETDRSEEFAGRFPGWASLVETQARELARMERVIEGLNDRLTHDPFLSASLHDVLSSVTAIRSASAILADETDIAPEWQARFHRNILEDSRRLAQSTEQLVSYLDAGADIEQGMSLPQEELDAWLEAEDWRFDLLEADPDSDFETIIDSATGLVSIGARHAATSYLRQYAEDVRSVSQTRLTEAIASVATDPVSLAGHFSVSLPLIFRRLASLPADAFPDRERRGLVACDGSGTLIVRKQLPDFELPRYGAACPRWSLFLALQRPMQPVRQTLRMSTPDARRLRAWAVSEVNYPSGLDAPSVTTAWMLLEPDTKQRDGEPVIGVGTSCRVCAMTDCPARREVSLLAAARSGESSETET